MKIKLYIYSLVSMLLIGCSSGRYMVADRLMKANDYQAALAEYIGIAELDGSLIMSHDIRALTGAMIAYYQLGKYQNSFAISKQILSIDKYNGSAIFYAGMNLEMMNKRWQKRFIVFTHHCLVLIHIIT